MYQESDIEDKIVELLKIHLKYSLTLLQFAELRDESLYSLINKIVHGIDPTQQESIGVEARDDTVNRISEFLRVVRYPFPLEPERWDDAFLRSDISVLHPMILFLLRNYEDLKKISYIARYYEEVFVPEEFKCEESVQTLLQSHQELRDTFKNLYDENEELGDTNIEQLKAKIREIELDKGGIKHKIGEFKRQLSQAQPPIQNIDGFLSVIAKIRQESETEIRLQTDYAKLLDEKDMLEKRQVAVVENQKTFVSRMNDKKAKLISEIGMLKNSSTGGEDKQLFVIQQQIISAKKRFEQKEQSLIQVKRQREEEEMKFSDRSQLGIVEVPNQALFDQYLEKLKSKNLEYQKLNSEMAIYKKKLAGLIRTGEIIKKQFEDVESAFNNLEKANQVVGFRDVISQIQTSSDNKTEHDELKSQTLAELTQIETEITKQIQSRNEELKPIVAQIQEKKRERAEIEIQFLQAQAKFEKTIRENDQSIVEFEEEIRKYQREVAAAQSKYFTVQGLSAIQERQVRRAKDETQASESQQPISRKIQTYADYFHKEVRRLRKENHTLKEKKDQMGEQSGDQMKQLDMFNALKRLLQIKEESQKKELAHQKAAIDIAQKEKNLGDNLDLRDKFS